MSALSVAKRSSQPVYFHILSMDLPERDPSWVSLSDERLAIFREAVGTAAPVSKVEQIDCWKKICSRIKIQNETGSAGLRNPFCRIDMRFVEEVVIKNVCRVLLRN